MAAIGEVDEANSAIGLAIAGLDEDHELVAKRLRRIQNEMFDLGADLATPEGMADALRITEGQVEALEKAIDVMNAELSPLTSFILPGGSDAVARLHFARSAVRRAERATVELNEDQRINPQALAYLNRLSDHLFVCARTVASDGDGGDVLWQPGATREG